MTAAAWSITSASRTDIGLRRAQNEDAVRVVRSEDDRALLAVVADGMGGHGFGEVASALAVETVAAAFDANAACLRETVCAAVRAANRAVYDAAAGNDTLRGMGTTCTAIAIRDGEGACAHVGDTRVYLLRRGAIYTMTEDHSQVQTLVTAGMLTADAARRHDDRHVLLRAVGTAPGVEVACWQAPLPLRHRDRLLLCTDGLHGLCTNDELLRIVEALEPREACERLIALARARGGDDNITAVVIDIADLSIARSTA
jgi:protein phosphatase